MLAGCHASEPEISGTLPPIYTKEETGVGQDLPPAGSGSVTHGFVNSSGERTKNIPYTGDEISVPCSFCGTGVTEDGGYGCVLILDGVPQPYPTDLNPENRYIHIVPVESGV